METIYFSCSKCDQMKPSEEFHSKSGKTTYSMCRACRQQYSREWMKKKLSFPHAEVWLALVTISGYQCARCHYNEFPAAMEFVSLPGIDKTPDSPLYNLVNRYCYYPTNDNWEALMEKLQGHVMLCSNCHNALRAGAWELAELNLTGPILRRLRDTPVAPDASPRHSPDASPIPAPG